MKCCVIGAGAWGTTLAILLHYNGHKVTVWEWNPDYAKEMREKGENVTYLPGFPLPPEINITSDLHEAVNGQNMIVVAVPSQFARGVISKLTASDIGDAILVSISKGIEKDTLMTMSQMFLNELKGIQPEQVGVISGPSHAEEVVRRIPTTVVAASSDKETSESIQAAFITSYFRVYSSQDMLGVELGGAFKNVIAIAAGIIDGVGFGDNTKAAVMTRGIKEIARLGIALGAQPSTFSGLSGMGDLIVTCMSRHSRNRFVGEKIGSGMTLDEVLKSMTAVAEGIETSRSASQLAAKHNIETPITTQVYKVLFEQKDPNKATTDLMTRTMKEEKE